VGFWFWFGVFAAIAVLALLWYALIGLSLAKKAKGLEPAGARLQALSEKLSETQSKQAEIDDLVPAIDQGAEKVLSRRKAVVKANKQRKEDRQRSLVERLKNMKIDESRFR
jgi:hypothetical protein